MLIITPTMGDLKLHGVPPMLQPPNPCPMLIGIKIMAVNFIIVAIPLVQTQTSRARIVPPSLRNHKGGHTASAGNSSNAGSNRKKSGKSNSLSSEEMAQLRSEGKCFNCKNIGHLSQNCPDKDMMPRNGNRRRR